MSSPIVGPTPPYNNPPIQPQNFLPSRFVISAITLGVTTLVTTAINNNYVLGQLCRLLIPEGFGSIQLNEQTGYVVSIPAANQVELTINSTNADVFVNAGLSTRPQIIPVGDINTGIISSTGRNIPTTYIPGSFINIKP